MKKTTKKAAKKATETAQAVTVQARNDEAATEIESGFDGPIICPIPTDPACGDKTPAVVQWWKDNHPDEYAKRYGSRVHPAPDDTATRAPYEDREDEGIEDEAQPRKPAVLKN